MNKVLLAGMGLYDPTALLHRLQEQGVSVPIADALAFPKEEVITYTCPPVLEPLPFFEKELGKKIVGRDPGYYANNIAKRRKKNKNKKTHRK